ncbi:glutamic acid-rich protein [Drosophila kikkawai]|uniref:Glutamic acid-rich protein n=1 Tax=Drosophila kikkawai TaxID=30033 RepID=A0A6P4J413_DROKI|nr:uncharacterized protein LOC108084116 [Drosophila kikkawai]
MAPFNNCSCCQIRTRKVIRHPYTRKNIYVCPACFKTNKYQEKGNRRKVQPEEDNAKENVEKQTNEPEKPLETQQNEENNVQKDLDKPLEHQEAENEAPKEEEDKPTENVQEKILQNDVGEEMQTGSTTNDNIPSKITPPLMEIVVMNNRKYIAVSETANAVKE